MGAIHREVVVIFAIFFAGAILDATLADDPVIEEFTDRELEKLVEESDFVAVFWYTKNCKTCDAVLEGLETIDDETDQFNVDFVKVRIQKWKLDWLNNSKGPRKKFAT